MHRSTAVFLLVLATTPMLDAQSTPERATPAVVTTGEATVKRTPDRAWVTVATETQAPSPAVAQQQNATKMTQVLAKLQELGIAEKAIQTSSYDVHPEYDWVEGQQKLRGYASRNTIEVRVDDLQRLGTILDAVVGAGATAVSGVRFDLQDRDAAEREALKQAVADARARADAAAAAAGLKVARVLRIEEHRQGDTGPRPLARGLRAEAAEASTPIQPGEIEIRASVTMTAEVHAG